MRKPTRKAARALADELGLTTPKSVKKRARALRRGKKSQPRRATA